MDDDRARHVAQDAAGRRQPGAPVAILARRRRERGVERQRAQRVRMAGEVAGRREAQRPARGVARALHERRGQQLRGGRAGARGGIGDRRPRGRPARRAGLGQAPGPVRAGRAVVVGEADRAAARGRRAGVAGRGGTGAARPDDAHAGRDRVPPVVGDDDLQVVGALPGERGEAARERGRAPARRDDDRDHARTRSAARQRASAAGRPRVGTTTEITRAPAARRTSRRSSRRRRRASPSRRRARPPAARRAGPPR